MSIYPYETERYENTVTIDEYLETCVDVPLLMLA